MTAPVAAVHDLWAHSLRRMVGRGGATRSRLLVASLVAVALLPAVVGVGMPVLLERFAEATGSRALVLRVDALVGDPDLVPDYARYFGAVSAVLVLGAALAAADVLAADRDSDLLDVYRLSRLGPGGYLAGKALAVATVLLAMTAMPLLLLLAGRIVVGAEVGDGGELVGRGLDIAIASAVVAGSFGAVALAAGSLTERIAPAAAAVIVVLTASGAAASFLVEAGMTWGAALDLREIPIELAARILGRAPEGPLSTGELGACAGAAVAGSLSLAAWAQRRRWWGGEP